MQAPRVAISQDFFQAFAGIPRTQQKKVNEFVSRFRTNPQSSGINYEKINDAANPNYRSVRIDQDYRGIVLKPEQGNVFLMLWVDKHDDAYQWARRHKCEVHPETGSLQLYAVNHGEAPEGETADSGGAALQQPPTEETSPLFSIRDREYLRLGVPEDYLEQVKGLTRLDELEAMKDRLPVEAFEALYFLAEGEPLEEVMQSYGLQDGPAVDTADLDAALARAQSQRRFHVVEDDLELRQMLEAPLAQWRVFLHPSQRQLVERHWNGPVRVLGGAGTGKTVVAMHRARWLVRHVLQEDERLLFTTSTRNLAVDIQSQLEKICSPREMKKIEVTHIDAWVRRFLEKQRQPAKIVYPGMAEFDACWQTAIQSAPADPQLPDSFYEEEWERVVLPQRVMNQQDYFRASRLGRGVALTRRQRAALWPVFEEMRFQLHQKGLTTSPDAVFMVQDMINDGAVARPYRAAVVDETQDLGMESLQLIRTLVPEAEDDLMLVGDGHQRIYGRKAALSKSGINIRGRGRKLRINYRTTEQIRRFATALLEGVDIDDLDEGQDPLTGYRSLFDGQTPVIKGFNSREEEQAFIADEIRRLIDDGVEASDICIVARTKTPLAPLAKVLHSRNIEHYTISRESADQSRIPGVRMANMHRVKGLEFRIVFLMDVRHGQVPLRRSTESTDDPVEKRLKDLNERALLHVAATRAVNGLYVTWAGQASEYLNA